MPEITSINSVEQLRRHVALLDVFLAEEHAARKGKSSVSLDKEENNANNPAAVGFHINVAPSALKFRVSLTHESLSARVVVEYEATYSSTRVFSAPREVIEEFGRYVLTETLFPLARNAVYAAWARLGVRSKSLSLLKRHDIELLAHNESAGISPSN